ncbi:hypothetical protein [Chitinophaga parva]|uniref:hypothetical protein n=1 Tax=Chitinophaga parva TaxID=2169414 RepID=UPI001403100B|nr:hypothetical protein [Chitinophaga parva]
MRINAANGYYKVPFISFAIGKEILCHLRPLQSIQIPLAPARQYRLSNIYIQESAYMNDPDISIIKADIYCGHEHNFPPLAKGHVNAFVIPLCSGAACDVENHDEKYIMDPGRFSFSRIPQGVHSCRFPAGLKSFFYILFSDQMADQLAKQYPGSGILNALQTARYEQRAEVLAGNENQEIDTTMEQLLVALTRMRPDEPGSSQKIRQQAIKVLCYALYRCAQPRKQLHKALPFYRECRKANLGMQRLLERQHRYGRFMNAIHSLVQKVRASWKRLRLV